MERVDKVKSHLLKQKKVYLIAGGCFVAGLVVAPKQIVIVDALKGFQWKSPAANQVTTILARRGHPGNIIKCNETGEMFASQNRAAKALGLDSAQISRHLTGKSKNSNVNGFTFEKLGEAKAA